MGVPHYVTADIEAHLDAIACHFKNPKITLVVRSPDVKDADVVVTRDDLELVIAAIRDLAKPATSAGEP